MDRHPPDFLAEFRQAMLEVGLIVKDEIAADGQIHRCDTTERNGKGDGAYVLHMDAGTVVGGFENHQAGTGWVVWKPERAPIIDPEQKRKMEAALQAMRVKRDAEADQRRKRAAEQASKMWSEARPADQNHPYLARKGVRAHELRVGTWKGVANTLLVPITDGENFLSMQFIFPEKHVELGRDKDFLPGGKKSGGFFPIGDEISGVVVLCEGYATGATIHEATGLPVIIAFDATNLPTVAINIRATYPHAEIIVAADNDHKTPANPGLQAAEKVLQTVGNARVISPEFDDGDAGTDWNDYAARHGVDAVRQHFVGHAEPRESLFVSVGDLVDNLQPIRWLVEDYFEEDSLSLVFGAPGGGKSFVTVGIACCVATGTPWHGKPVTQGPVFYIAGEGHNGLARRFAAWQSHSGVNLKEAQLYKSKKAISIFNEKSAQDLYQSVNDIAIATGQAPKLVILDTVARNFGDGDENSTEDMGKFIEHLDTYIRIPFGCNVLLVHHSGHNMDRARGSSALKAALDAEYQVVNEGGLVTLSATKMKDAEQPSDMAFRFKYIELGELEGVEIGSVVLDPQDDALDFKVGTDSAGEDISAKTVLLALSRGWLPFSQLKDALGCTQAAAQRAVKKCAEKGLLTKDGAGYKMSEKASAQLSLTGRNLVRKSGSAKPWQGGDE